MPFRERRGTPWTPAWLRDQGVCVLRGGAGELAGLLGSILPRAPVGTEGRAGAKVPHPLNETVGQPLSLREEISRRCLMASLQGFRCRHCRMEILARPPERSQDRAAGWTPPVACCGGPLQRLPSEQVLADLLFRRLRANCPRCEYEVQLIVPPVGPLHCLLCQQAFATSDEIRWQEDVAAAPPVEKPV